MNKNQQNSFKEEIELFIQMLTVESQFERLLRIESIYNTLSKREQELIYEEFKRLLSLKYEKDKGLIDDFFFFGGPDIVEPNYSKSKLYQNLLNRYKQEQIDKIFELDNEFQKLPEENQKEMYENIKRLIKKSK